MVVALLLVLLIQAGSGLFTSDDIMVDGPLVDQASGAVVRMLCTVHRLLVKLIFVLAAIHIAVVAAYLLICRENLIRPMVTGRKQVPAGMEVALPRLSGLLSAALIFGLAVTLVVLLLRTT